MNDQFPNKEGSAVIDHAGNEFLEGYDSNQQPTLHPSEDMRENPSHLFPNKPILFLDFDGVLNGLDWWYEMGNSGMDLLRRPFNPYNVAVVNQIFEEVECDVVLTSAWRFFGFKPGYIKALLSIYGFQGNVTGDLGDLPEPFKIRGIPIQTWMVNNNRMNQNICILDDMDRSRFGWLNGYLVQTDIVKGCSDGNADEAIEMLKGEFTDGRPKRWEAAAK